MTRKSQLLNSKELCKQVALVSLKLQIRANAEVRASLPWEQFTTYHGWQGISLSANREWFVHFFYCTCSFAFGGSNSALHKSKNISLLMDSDVFNSMPDELKFIHLSSLGDALPSSLPKAQPRKAPAYNSYFPFSIYLRSWYRSCKERLQGGIEDQVSE